MVTLFESVELFSHAEFQFPLYLFTCECNDAVGRQEVHLNLTCNKPTTSSDSFDPDFQRNNGD